DLTSDEGLDILYRLAATADIFLTNKLPSVRRKLRIGIEEIRAANPVIIYVRGTGQGERGPDADKGSYDSLAFWNRSGIAIGMPPPDDAVRRNPLTNNYLTQDGRWLAFICLQAGKYWPELCAVIDRPELATDARFADHDSLLANSGDAIEILTATIGARPLAE